MVTVDSVVCQSFEVKDDKATLIELTNTSIGSFRIVDTCKQDGKPIVVVIGDRLEGQDVLASIQDAGQVDVALIVRPIAANRKNTLIGGAIYQITTPNGKVVGNIQGDLNGQAYSGIALVELFATLKLYFTLPPGIAEAVPLTEMSVA